jgi:four helix bundle protein
VETNTGINPKSENPNSKNTRQTINDCKPYDLEERTEEFARCVRRFVKRLPRTVANFEDIKQFVKASGSVGANYIEANEALGRNDFLMRIRIAKKEAKESAYWLRLMDCGTNEEVISERAQLVQESMELMLILAAILRKSECKPSSS